MFSSDFILAVQESFSYLRKVTTTADHTAIGFTTMPILSREHTSFTSSSTSSHLDLPPPSAFPIPDPSPRPPLFAERDIKVLATLVPTIR